VGKVELDLVLQLLALLHELWSKFPASLESSELRVLSLCDESVKFLLTPIQIWRAVTLWRVRQL